MSSSGYASDISNVPPLDSLHPLISPHSLTIARTYPASGTFTPPQRELYAAVLSAQKQLITLCTEAAGLSLYELHHWSCEYLKRELGQIAGFGRDKVGELLERVLYPHFVGHPIGIGAVILLDSLF